MRFLKWGFLSLMGFALLLAATLQLTSTSWKTFALKYFQGQRTIQIADVGNFTQREITAGTPEPWQKSLLYNKATLSQPLAQYLKASDSASFVVVKQGKLLHESYFAPYNATSKTNSFAIAQSLGTLLVGAAVQDGFIQSFDEPLTTFVPEFSKDPLGSKATLAQLSAMSSGLSWREDFDQLTNGANDLYDTHDVQAAVLALKFDAEPGTRYQYSSAAAQLLSLALARALKAKNPQLTLSLYMSQKFWQPLGMEGSGFYTLDRESEAGGMERSFCCLFSSARNFARFGQLLLQEGQWVVRQGETAVPTSLLSVDFVHRISQAGSLMPNFGHALWMDLKYKHPFYLMHGQLGQYIIVVPDQQMVIVHLGQKQSTSSSARSSLPDEVYLLVEEAIKLANPDPVKKAL